MSSKYCKDEFDYAERHKKIIIPILFFSFDTNQLNWFRIGRVQWADFTQDYKVGMNKLINAIEFHTQKKVISYNTCFICQANTPNSSNRCPQCHAPYQPEELNQLANLPSTTLQAYISYYQPRINSSMATVEDLLVLSVVYIHLDMLSIAKPLLERILQINPLHHYSYYLLSIVSLKGKRPWQMTKSEADKVLAIATKSHLLNPQRALYLALIVLIKADYFEPKGFNISRPYLNEFSHAVSKDFSDCVELKMLLRLVPISNTKIVKFIETPCQ